MPEIFLIVCKAFLCMLFAPVVLKFRFSFFAVNMVKGQSSQEKKSHSSKKIFYSIL